MSTNKMHRQLAEMISVERWMESFLAQQAEAVTPYAAAIELVGRLAGIASSQRVALEERLQEIGANGVSGQSVRVPRTMPVDVGGDVSDADAVLRTLQLCKPSIQLAITLPLDTPYCTP